MGWVGIPLWDTRDFHSNRGSCPRYCGRIRRHPGAAVTDQETRDQVAYRILTVGAGTQFDPHLVEMCGHCLQRPNLFSLSLIRRSDHVPNAFRIFYVYFKTPTYYHHGNDRLLGRGRFFCTCHGTGHRNPWSGSRPSASACSWKPALHKRSRHFWTPAATSTIQTPVTLLWIQWKRWEHRSQPKRPSKGCR